MSLILTPPPLIAANRTSNKLYITNVASAFTPPSLTGWSTTFLMGYRELRVDAAGTGNSSGGVMGGEAAYLHWIGVSKPLVSPVSFSGVMSVVLGYYYTISGRDAKPIMVVWVSQGQTNNNRGTLYAGGAYGEFYNLTAEGHLGSATLSPVSALAGDCIVIEHATYVISPLGNTCAQYIGGTATPDLTDGDTNVTTRPATIIMPQLMTFAQ